MTWNRLSPWLGTAARLALGIVWIAAAAAKLHSPRAFGDLVRAYDMTPEWLTAAIAYGAPVLMIGLAALLIVGITVRLAAATSGVLLVVFLIGLVVADARSRPVSCGCFGTGTVGVGSGPSVLAILLSLVLLALAVFLTLWPFTHASIDSFLARHDYVEVPSAKRMRDPQARRKYETQVAETEKEARNRDRYLTGALSLVVVLVTVVGIGVQSGRTKISGTLDGANASPTHGVEYGKVAAATVDLYEDFACTACRVFEQQVHATLDKDVIANLAQVRYHPIALLDPLSKNRYSTRASNAAMCASDAGVDQFVAYWNVLFGSVKGQRVQPAPHTTGPSNSRLITLAKAAKLTSAQISTMTSCVSTDQYKGLVEAMGQKANVRGVVSVPVVYVNDVRLSSPSLSTLEAAIAKADAKGPAPSPSPTPSPTPTVPSSPAATPTTSPATSPAASSPAGSSTAPKSSKSSRRSASRSPSAGRSSSSTA